MIRGFREIAARALRPLAVGGVLIAAAPGCGGGAEQGDVEGEIPQSVQKSNQQMEDFMKSQQATQK